MLEALEVIDRDLFIALNGLHSSFMDELMFHISGKWQWIPFYFFLLYLIYRKYGIQSWKILLGTAVLILLADQLSVKLFKNVFERYRPCHNLEIKEVVHIVNNKCGGKYGFVSSHAANTFSLGSYLGLLLSTKNKRRALYLLLLWATIVSYSRLYLGVHYPSDLIGGALLGVAIGILIYFISLKWLKISN